MVVDFSAAAQVIDGIQTGRKIIYCDFSVANSPKYFFVKSETRWVNKDSLHDLKELLCNELKFFSARESFSFSPFRIPLTETELREMKLSSYFDDTSKYCGYWLSGTWWLDRKASVLVYEPKDLIPVFVDSVKGKCLDQVSIGYAENRFRFSPEIIFRLEKMKPPGLIVKETNIVENGFRYQPGNWLRGGDVAFDKPKFDEKRIYTF